MKQPIVVENQSPYILRLNHKFPSKGHFSIEKTYRRAQERFFWPSSRRNFRN